MQESCRRSYKHLANYSDWQSFHSSAQGFLHQGSIRIARQSTVNKERGTSKAPLTLVSPRAPMFVPLTMAALVNLLISFLRGIIKISRGRRSMEEWFIEMFIAGFVVVNCLPIYEAMVMRKDKGRIPTKTTIISAVLVYALYTAASFTLKI